MGKGFIEFGDSSFYYLPHSNVDPVSTYNSAECASNNLSFPAHHITTDSKGMVKAVSPSFTKFTGYEVSSFLGRSCNFLQGKDTSKSDVIEIRLAMQRRQRVCVVILNYCKNGSPFWNILTIQPRYTSVPEVSGFDSSIISLPIPPNMFSKPKLCLSDAFALINVFASVPKSPKSMKKKVASYFQPQTYGKYDFVSETMLPTEFGDFKARAYRDKTSSAEPLVIMNVDSTFSPDEPVIMRVHDQCVTSEVFGSIKCDCKLQLHKAMDFVSQHKNAFVIYLPQEGRGIGLANKIAAYSLQQRGYDTVDANRELGLPDDARRYEAVRDILEDLEVKDRIQLLTNNPRKIECLKELGINAERVQWDMPKEELSVHSLGYVTTKKQRMGHLIA